MSAAHPFRVLFVCIGNAYRSQIAEAFARTLSHGLLAAESAGLTPVYDVPENTIRVMREKGIDVSQQFPKALFSLDLKAYDLIVNMTGLPVQGLPAARTRSWIVPDPVGQPDSVLREVRDEIESLVMGLILEKRRAREQREHPRLTPKMRGI